MSADPEVDALRTALTRQQQDLYALQQALNRATTERDQWRAAYYRALREKAELTTTLLPHVAA